MKTLTGRGPESTKDRKKKKKKLLLFLPVGKFALQS